MENTDCIFCKIISGQIHCMKIAETDLSVAILDAFSVTKGHSLIIPKRHCTDYLEMTPEETADAAELMKDVAAAIKKATGAEALNLVSNLGALAGQMVFHAHTHIIPRFKGDSMTLKFGKKVQLNDSEKIQLIDSIKKEL